MKCISAGIWAGLCFYTIQTGEVSVLSQSIAQGSLAIILAIGAFTDS